MRLYSPKARMINFGTDEVFGEAPEGLSFKESDTFRPGNPYSATKCGQIALGMAYERTYGLCIMHTFCMNLFGSRQNPEKFLPTVIRKILSFEPVHIHSEIIGGPVGPVVTFVSRRNWIHVDAAADACLFLLQCGKSGEGYSIASSVELANDELAKKVAGIMGMPIGVEFVDYHGERPGMDRRYSLDGSKLAGMGWVPPRDFEEIFRQVWHTP
jgi:dTDP-glucose 4,6-dehydratase